MSNFIIDSDKDPFVEDGDSIHQHNQMGMIPFDLNRVGLHQAKEWHGNPLIKELSNLPALNACWIDFFLEHKELIPEEWKNYGLIPFFGTVYMCRRNGFCYVRALLYYFGEWDENTFWFGMEKNECMRFPVLV